MQMATGRHGSMQMATGRHGSMQMATGRHGSEQTTTGGRGNEQTTTGGRGSEQTQNTGRKSDGVYANISETIVESDQGVSTSPLSAAKHVHEQSQPAEPVWIPDRAPQLHTSKKSYSFQEKVQHLFQQFPGLVEGQETAIAPDPEVPDPAVDGLYKLSK